MARWGNGATTDVVVCGKEPICSNPKHRQLGCVQLKNAAKTLLKALAIVKISGWLQHPATNDSVSRSW